MAKQRLLQKFILYNKPAFFDPAFSHPTYIRNGNEITGLSLLSMDC